MSKEMPTGEGKGTAVGSFWNIKENYSDSTLEQVKKEHERKRREYVVKAIEKVVKNKKFKKLFKEISQDDTNYRRHALYLIN